MKIPSGAGWMASSNQPLEPSGKVKRFSIWRVTRFSMQSRRVANISVVSMPGYASIMVRFSNASRVLRP